MEEWESLTEVASCIARCCGRLPVISKVERELDAYFSADVETDGPIPGPFSILSFAMVYAGSFDGKRFERPRLLALVPQGNASTASRAQC